MGINVTSACPNPRTPKSAAAEKAGAGKHSLVVTQRQPPWPEDRSLWNLDAWDGLRVGLAQPGAGSWGSKPGAKGLGNPRECGRRGRGVAAEGRLLDFE